MASLPVGALDVLPQRRDQHRAPQARLTCVAYSSPRERGPCKVNLPTLGAQKPFVYPVVAASVPESPMRSSFCPRGLREDSPEAARSRTRKEKPWHRGSCGHVLRAAPGGEASLSSSARRSPRGQAFTFTFLFRVSLKFVKTREARDASWTSR